MKNRTVIILSAVFFLNLIGKGETVQNKSVLQIYLPPNVTVENNTPNLGEIAVIKGQQSLLKKANDVALGRISLPDRKIIIDRPTILARLAGSGIDSSRVTFIGAEKVTIGQIHQIISSEDFIETAINFLKANPPDASACRFDLVRKPEDLVLPGKTEDLQLSISPAASEIKNQARVRIAVFAGEKELETREVTFRLKYTCRQIVAKIDIPQGAALGPDNTKIEQVISDNAEPHNQRLPYGHVAKRRIPANTVITANMAGPALPELLLERNQSVLIKINTAGLSVTATGKALQQGRAGEYIKVQNLDSQRIIMAKINEDGSVEPVF
jgi:flagella basal body P-ring formation protein FlgA